jgi:tetratricopeptide (TPR) repeat protein
MSKNLLWDILKEKRDYRDAWIILGYSYLKLEAFNEAIDALEEAKRQDPEKPETLFYLGLAYAGNGQLSEAIDILELALSNGYEPSIHVEQKLAELYFQSEDYEKASKKYEDVISLNPSDINYFIRPIYIYIDKLQNPEKALSLAEKANLHHPDNAMSYNLLGWAYVANHDFINAKKNLEKSLELNESFDAPYLNMGWMYEKQGNYERAKLFYKKAFDVGTNSPVADLAAERYNALIDKELNSNIMVNLFN